MTEEEIRAIISAAFAKAAADAGALVDPERNIQMDTVFGLVQNICDGVATAVLNP